MSDDIEKYIDKDNQEFIENLSVKLMVTKKLSEQSYDDMEKQFASHRKKRLRILFVIFLSLVCATSIFYFTLFNNSVADHSNTSCQSNCKRVFVVVFDKPGNDIGDNIIRDIPDIAKSNVVIKLISDDLNNGTEYIITDIIDDKDSLNKILQIQSEVSWNSVSYLLKDLFNHIAKIDREEKIYVVFFGIIPSPPTEFANSKSDELLLSSKDWDKIKDYKNLNFFFYYPDTTKASETQIIFQKILNKFDIKYEAINGIQDGK